jgi:ABC-type multidrug transport system fused ATPase/permease subunit
VAVVAGGGLAEVGPHAELVAAGGHYARLYESWITHHADGDEASGSDD